MHDGENHDSYVHYDISPSNIIIKPDGAIKLIDFGTAFTSDSIPNHYHTEEIGTPRYMSPQKLAPSPSPEFGKESDVYAMGALGYTMLAGMEPFHEALGDLRRQIRFDIPINIGCDNAELEGLILSCLEKQPQNRPTAYELATQLQEI